MTEEHKIIFLMTLLAIALAYMFKKLKSPDSPLSGLFSGSKSNGSGLKPDRNGTQNDYLLFIRKILNRVKKEKWYVILPGTLAYEDFKTTLNGVIVTPNGVLGFKAYGFGGKISKKGNEWTQVLNGTKKDLMNIEAECQTQHSLLRSILEKSGMGDLPLEVVAVFTTPGVYLENITSNRYLTGDGFFSYLETEKFHLEEGMEAKEIGKKLEELKYSPS